MFYNLLKQNLKNSHRNIAKAISNVAFFLLMLFSLLLFLQEAFQNTQYNQLVIRVSIWFSLLFSIFYQSSNFFKEDYIDGTIEQMIIICENLESYVLAKIISFWLDYCLPIVIVSLIIMNIFGFSLDQIAKNASLLIFSSISISAISCLCSSFNIISKRATLLAILAFPIAIPIIMISIVGSLQILAPMSIFLSIVCLFSVAKIIRIVSE